VCVDIFFSFGFLFVDMYDVNRRVALAKEVFNTLCVCIASRVNTR